MPTLNTLLRFTLITLLAAPLAMAHHDSVPATGADAMLQHMEVGDTLVMELVMPHRHATGNQLLLNFFAPEDGQSALPESVVVTFSPAESAAESQPVTLDRNGPVYSAPTTGITGPGEWQIRIQATLHDNTDAVFTLSSEFY